MGVYDIPQQMEYINHLIDQADGELTPEVEAEIERLKEGFIEKLDPLVSWIRNLDIDEENFKAEAAFFTKKKRTRANLKERIKGMIVNGMIALGMDKHKGRFNVTLCQASRPSIEWEGEGEIPKKFTRVKIEPDGDMIYQAWKDGKLPKGFKVTFSNYIRIT